MLSLRFLLSCFTSPGCQEILWLPWMPLEQSWNTIPEAAGLYRLRLRYQDPWEEDPPRRKKRRQRLVNWSCQDFPLAKRQWWKLRICQCPLFLHSVPHAMRALRMSNTTFTSAVCAHLKDMAAKLLCFHASVQSCCGTVFGTDPRPGGASAANQVIPEAPVPFPHGFSPFYHEQKGHTHYV